MKYIDMGRRYNFLGFLKDNAERSTMNPEKTELNVLKFLVIVSALILIAPLFTGIVSADPDVLYLHSEQMTLGSTTGYNMTTDSPTSSTATTFVVDSTNGDLYFFEEPVVNQSTTISDGKYTLRMWCVEVVDNLHPRSSSSSGTTQATLMISKC